MEICHRDGPSENAYCMHRWVPLCPKQITSLLKTEQRSYSTDTPESVQWTLSLTQFENTLKWDWRSYFNLNQLYGVVFNIFMDIYMSPNFHSEFCETRISVFHGRKGNGQVLKKILMSVQISPLLHEEGGESEFNFIQDLLWKVKLKNKK